MRECCDKCKSKIIDGKCDCGEWFETLDEMNTAVSQARSFFPALLAFNDFNTDLIGGDHFSGSCFVFFKGDFEMCQKVKAFIRNLQLTENVQEMPEEHKDKGFLMAQIKVK